MRFEVYTTPNTNDGYGSKLFLRAAGSSSPGILLCRNDRWIAAQWSPNSRFLAVTDHNDGHIADVFIYRVVSTVEPPGVMHKLRYQSPDPGTYDTKWEVVGWDSKHATATLLTNPNDASRCRSSKTSNPSELERPPHVSRGPEPSGSRVATGSPQQFADDGISQAT